MHEFHLMTQVVKAVGKELNGTGSGRLSTVRLKVSALSHLLTHDHSALQMVFELAARGTKAEGAALEIIPVPGEAWCPRCTRDTMVTESDDVCPVCGDAVIAKPTEPEVVLHELVVQE
ncbi:MAG: hydrogenase maturation nickel metallochaperone HypA [Nitrospira sp.]|nr:hydrogenase maturation nickel metallochaperone HypA [Nitrospira sp.]